MMRYFNFNDSQFFLSLSSYNEDTFLVRAFYSIDDSISSHYHFLIEVITETYISPEKLVNLKATLFWKNFRHGIIAIAHDVGKQKEGYCYELELVSPLYPLLNNSHDRVFVNKTLSEIMAEIFKKDNLNLFRFEFQKDSVIPYRVQYQETDFEFFNNLIQEYQLSWLFDHDEKISRLLVVDNLDQQEKNILAIENIPQSIIRLEKDYFNEVLLIETEERILTPGQMIKFQDKNYRILNIEYHAHQKIEAHKNHGLRYIAKLKLISPQIKFYTLNPNFIIKKHTPLLTAITESEGECYPTLDSSGRYYTRLFFDKSNVLPAQSSQPQYLIEPHDGMHFPERAGTEMAVSHIDGNINQPILLGILNNEETPAPVTSENNSQHIYRTYSGNQLFVEDKKNMNQIQLNNPKEKNILLLDATQSKNRTQLQSREGRIKITAGQDIETKSKNSHYQQSKNHRITVEKDQKIQTNTDNIQLKSGKNTALNAKNNLQLKSNSQSIMLNSERQTELTVKNNLSLQNQSGKIILKSTHNNIQIISNKSIQLNAKESASLSSGGSSLSMNSSGLNFNTSQLKVNASSISCPQPMPGSVPSSPVNIDDAIEVENMISKPDIPVPFIPLVSQIQNSDDDDFKLFVATVYGEAGSVQSAWEPVADTIMTRAENNKQNVRGVITRQGQFSCYTNPDNIDWDNLPQDGNLFWNEHGEFLKAWTYLNNKNINGEATMNTSEKDLINQMESALRPYYEGEVKYKINYYYSPAAQIALNKKYPERYKILPGFLDGLENPETYRVLVPNVPENKFKFYYIPDGVE
jgi:hypothetical protein